MLSVLLVLRSCLNFHVAVLSSLLLSSVWNQCQALQSLRFLSTFLFYLDRTV
jgi:hypothetical protein